MSYLTELSIKIRLTEIFGQVTEFLILNFIEFWTFIINYIYFLFFYVRLSYFYFLEFVNE